MNRQENIRQHFVDYLAISELVQKYTYVINHKLWAELPDLFTADAVWIAEPPLNLRFSGLSEIQSFIPNNVGKLEILSQTSTETLIHFQSEQEACVHSKLTETGRFSESGKGMFAIGNYEDVVVQEGGVWKFRERKFFLKYIDENYPFTGNVVL